MSDFLRKLFGKQNQNSTKQKQNATMPKTKVLCNDTGLEVIHPNGDIESAKWDEIIKVSVITTSQGPIMDDVFLVIFKREKGCLVPSEAIGYNDVFEKVSKFDGFNFTKYIEAMSSSSDNEFVCWQKTIRDKGTGDTILTGPSLGIK